VPRWRALAALAVGGLALLLLFGLVADFDRVATVRGIVAPASGVSRLVAPRAGIVTAVLVRQGARVRRGAPILRIASTALLPSGRAAPAERLAAFRREQQLAREGIGVEAQRAEAERARLGDQMAQLAASARSLDTQAALQRQRIAGNEARLRSLAPLRDRGYVSLLTYQQQEEMVLTLRQQLAELEQRRAAAASELDQRRLQAAELGAESRRTTLQSAATVAELERGADEAQTEAEILLAAPVAGRVAALHVLPGRSVAAAEEVATMVQGDALEAVLSVPSSAAGSLRPGQAVTLRFDAFPYQRYGVGRGVVTEIAATTSPAAGDAAPGYVVRVSLARNGAPFALRPDMALSASIVIERRSLLDWLLAPLRQRWRERAGG
jgi:membrane fusion protein